MKLYNVYRLCKLNIESLDGIEITKKADKIFIVENWGKIREIIETIKKIPVLKTDINNLIESIPDTVRHHDKPLIGCESHNQLLTTKNTLFRKMTTIIELYESMGLSDVEDKNAIDIKIPKCEDLSQYISYLKDINFIFTQCPFLQCKDEVLKFGSVDVGSNWLRLTITAASISVILSKTASVLDKALTLRSHYITIQQQEELLKSMQLKNELAEEHIDTFKQLKEAGMNIVIKQLEKEYGELTDPEERDRTERSLDKLILFLDKGGEIYSSLDAPDEIQVLFPEIQGDLELPDNIIKYLEEKQDGQE